MEIQVPQISSFNKEINSCKKVNSLKINYINKGKTYKIELIKKDLVIDSEEYFIFIDTNKKENLSEKDIKYIPKTFENDLKYLFVNSTENDTSNRSHDGLYYQKNPQGNYVLYKSSSASNILVLLNILNPNSKLTSGNDSGFNMKIPVIFIAVIIIVGYQFMKKKDNPIDNNEKMKIRKDVLDQINKFKDNKNDRNKGNYKSAAAKMKADSDDE